MALSRDDVDRDWYQVLGVSSSATAAEIKKSYRKLARDLHPDKNPDDAKAEARFKDVSRAYDILGDEAKRKEYDETRELIRNGGGFAPGGMPGGGGGFRGGVNVDLGDLFGGAAGGVGDIFGGLFNRGRGAARGPVRGEDVVAAVTVSFEQSMTGAEISVRLSGGAACDTCGGTGAAPGTHPTSCPVCSGRGVVTRNQGGFAFAEPCSRCGGSGTVIETPCPTCHGTGTRDRVQRVRVPAGVADGQHVRVRGRGRPGERGGPPGDLEVVVTVRPHPVFGRSGRNLTLTVPITFPEAALGATLRVPTLGDPVSLKVPAGTPSGKRLRVKGRGFPGKGGAVGDLIVTVEVAVPAKLDPAARELVEKLAVEVPQSPREHLDALLGGVTAGGTS
ncbi:MAG TPA: molecular chaperone DnaJ [Mycobacteriales bacterium]|nr:molecular chaperone DnaJ [Mycobacteriales bacterium]